MFIQIIFHFVPPTYNIWFTQKIQKLLSKKKSEDYPEIISNIIYHLFWVSSKQLRHKCLSFSTQSIVVWDKEKEKINQY